jgi:hypothetical protein
MISSTGAKATIESVRKELHDAVLAVINTKGERNVDGDLELEFNYGDEIKIAGESEQIKFIYSNNNIVYIIAENMDDGELYRYEFNNVIVNPFDQIAILEYLENIT